MLLLVTEEEAGISKRGMISTLGQNRPQIFILSKKNWTQKVSFCNFFGGIGQGSIAS
jgi:hypothetical protein